MTNSRNKRISVRTYPERAHYDKETFYRIVDESIFGQLSLVRDGWPHVVPMMVVRMDDEVLVHCRTGTELANDLRSGSNAALAITNVRGIVFAKSVRFHSVNFDSLVIYGSPRFVDNEKTKHDMFVQLLNNVWPGRAELVRPPSASELESVDVFAFNFQQCSAKVRRGGPNQKLDKPLDDGHQDSIWTGWADLDMCVTGLHSVSYGSTQANAGMDADSDAHMEAGSNARMGTGSDCKPAEMKVPVGTPWRHLK